MSRSSIVGQSAIVSVVAGVHHSVLANAACTPRSALPPTYLPTPPSTLHLSLLWLKVAGGGGGVVDGGVCGGDINLFDMI